MQKIIRHWWKKLKMTWTGVEIFHVPYFNIVKMIILPNAKYRLNEIPVKLPMAFLTEIEQKISQTYGNTKDPE